MKTLFVLVALVAMLAAPYAIQTNINSALNWLPNCNGHDMYGVGGITLATTPGDVSCTGGVTHYFCADVVSLNTSTTGSVFGGPNDVTPGSGYFSYVYIDFIGRTVTNGEVLNGYQDRTAPKSLWRPRVFVQYIGRTCMNWAYLNFNDNSPSNLIGFSPADNGANIGGFYLTNDTYGTYVPQGASLGGTPTKGGSNMPSAEVASDATINLKEVGTAPDYAGIRVYNLGYAGSWAFKQADTSFDMMFYKWTTWSQFQIVPMPFTTERGTYFGHNPTRSIVTFNINPVVNQPKSSGATAD